MSCKTLKLKGCEVAGSTFQGRIFKFINRDISSDVFSLKVRRINSILETITGVVVGDEVVFSLSSIENYKSDCYSLEYWAVFNEIGTEMIAIEDFTISSSPCTSCEDSSGATFNLSFPNETINYEVNVSVVNIGGATDVTWQDVKNKPTQFPPSAHTHNWSEITNKPVFFSGNYNDLAGKPNLFSGNYSDLVGKPVLFSGNYDDLTNKPSIPAAQVNSDWNSSSGVSQILNKPILFSGAYSDLTGKPTLFSGNYSDLSGKPTLFSGNYGDLLGVPEIPDYSQQTSLSTATVLSSSHNRKTLLIKSNLILTVPSGLPDGFEVALIADGGNLTFVSSGVTFKLNNSKTTLNNGGTAVLKKENGTANFYLKGDLS